MAIQGHAGTDNLRLDGDYCMNITFRADASLQIGTGHVMRCLTLADALHEHGAQCNFICRKHPGNLDEYIRSKGYVVHSLPIFQSQIPDASATLAHAAWLGARQAEDAQICAAILQEQKPDWLVVDHYALDAQWESVLRPSVGRIMVIDDLADRLHDCDLLLDQNLGRTDQQYAGKVPTHVKCMLGPRFGLLRPEFTQWRSGSLSKRSSARLESLLITLGGVDQHNATYQVLQALEQCRLPPGTAITVVMGATAPWLKQVLDFAKTMHWPTTVLTNITNMAEHMASADLAIGAAGSTSWERCALGVPTITAVLADNQDSIAEALHAQGVAINLGSPFAESFARKLANSVEDLYAHPAMLESMSQKAAALTDGAGTERVVREILALI